VLSPSSVTKPGVVEENSEKFMYFASVKFVCAVKSGHLSEHSPILWDISGVEKWTKVNQGLIKMYKAEVLGKFPVIQHFLFGSILKFEPLVA
jgi:serine/threonine-protein phosphatase 2A activator